MRDVALDIYQSWLDATSAAILNGDLDVVIKHFALPYTHKSLDGTMLVETQAELELGQKTYGNTLKGLGATDLIRIASRAEFLSDDYIEGYHVSHALKNASPVIDGFPNRAVLRRSADGQWRLIEIESAIRDISWPVAYLKTESRLPSSEGQLLYDARREGLDPLAEYQRFLDDMTRVMADAQLDAYLAMHDFPFQVHTESVDSFERWEKEASDFFHHHAEHMDRLGADTLVRRADHAEFIGPDQMCGYHTAYHTKDGVDVLAPVKSRMILNRVGEDWKMKTVVNTIVETVSEEEIVVTENLVTHRQIHERTKKNG